MRTIFIGEEIDENGKMV